MTEQSKTLLNDIHGDRTQQFPQVASLQSVEPATNVEATLVGWWKDLLRRTAVDLDEDFFELGGDSLTGVQLFSRIEKAYGIDLGLSSLFDARTVRQLAQLIRRHRVRPAPGSPIVAIQPAGSRPPLYIIPGGYGTTVLPFREVSLLLGADQPVYGFEAKMPEPDQELESMAERAARFTKELRLVQPQGPYSLFGWCGGGYIAFEMAQRLCREGQEVAVLVIAECAAPGYPAGWTAKARFRAERGIWRIRNFLKRGPKDMARWAAEHLRSQVKAMHLPVSNPDAHSSENPPSNTDELDEKIQRNIDRYHPTSYPGKSFVIVGQDYWDYCGVSPSVDPRLAWCKLSEGGSEVRIIPGSHMDILKGPKSGRLAQELKDCLERYAPRS